MIERSSHYGEYVRRSYSYDGSGVPMLSRSYFFLPFCNYYANIPLVSRIVAESKRLNSEEQDMEEVFRAKRLALTKA
jgi:hypothetical protein